MTAKDALKYIDKVVVYSIHSKDTQMDVNVRIIDMRDIFGRLDAKIEPVSGCGAIWVSIEKLIGLEEIG